MVTLPMFTREAAKPDVRGCVGFSEVRSCVTVEVDVLGSVPNKPTVSVDVKQHSTLVLFRCVDVIMAALFKRPSPRRFRLHPPPTHPPTTTHHPSIGRGAAGVD